LIRAVPSADIVAPCAALLFRFVLIFLFLFLYRIVGGKFDGLATRRATSWAGRWRRRWRLFVVRDEVDERVPTGRTARALT
jgi:hypothetical protein